VRFVRAAHDCCGAPLSAVRACARAGRRCGWPRLVGLAGWPAPLQRLTECLGTHTRLIKPGQESGWHY